MRASAKTARLERASSRAVVWHNFAVSEKLLQIAAKALDASAGFLEIGKTCGIGNTKRWSKAECRALHHGHTLRFQKLCDEVLVVLQFLARRRGLANGAGAGRKHVERALRARTVDAFGLVEHPDHQVAPLLEDPSVLRDEILR